MQNNNKLIKIVIVCVIVVVVFLIYFLFIRKGKYVGTWNCKGYDGKKMSDDYYVTMELKRNDEYIFGQYNDLDKNHTKGTYKVELEKDKKTTYLIDLQGSELLVDGEKEPSKAKMQLEMEIIDKNEALVVNTSTKAMYYCYK